MITGRFDFVITIIQAGTGRKREVFSTQSKVVIAGSDPGFFILLISVLEIVVYSG
jgi:hypothetical protein